MVTQHRPVALWMMIARAVAVVGATAALSARSLQRVLAAQIAFTKTLRFDQFLRSLQVHLLDAETDPRGDRLKERIRSPANRRAQCHGGAGCLPDADG